MCCGGGLLQRGVVGWSSWSSAAFRQRQAMADFRSTLLSSPESSFRLCLKAAAPPCGMINAMHVRRYDPMKDDAASLADPGEFDGRRAIFVAAPERDAPPRGWIVVDDYDGSEATVLFHAPSGDEHRPYVRALLVAALDEAPRLGFTSLLAHWRAGWRTAGPVLHELGFGEAASGIWRRSLG